MNNSNNNSQMNGHLINQIPQYNQQVNNEINSTGNTPIGTNQFGVMSSLESGDAFDSGDDESDSDSSDFSNFNRHHIPSPHSISRSESEDNVISTHITIPTLNHHEQSSFKSIQQHSSQLQQSHHFDDEEDDDDEDFQKQLMLLQKRQQQNIQSPQLDKEKEKRQTPIKIKMRGETSSPLKIVFDKRKIDNTKMNSLPNSHIILGLKENKAKTMFMSLTGIEKKKGLSYKFIKRDESIPLSISQLREKWNSMIKKESKEHQKNAFK